jgi:hypothetical protein
MRTAFTTRIATALVIATVISYLTTMPARADDPTPAPTAANPARAGADPGEMVILVEVEALDTPIRQSWRPAVRTLAQAVGNLTVFADGQRCGTVSLTGVGELTPSGDRVVRVKGSPQTPACGRAGSLITLRDARGRELAVEFRNNPGTTVQLDNLAPKPPVTGAEGNTEGLSSASRPVVVQPGLLVGGLGLLLAGILLSYGGLRHRRSL